MRRALIVISLFLTTFASAQIATRTNGLKKTDGLVPFYWDEKKGDLLFEMSPALLQGKLLHFTSLSTGVGSTAMAADRSTIGSSAVIHFERNGSRVFVVEENWRFRAEHGSPELKKVVERSFPTSIVASLP